MSLPCTLDRRTCEIFFLFLTYKRETEECVLADPLTSLDIVHRCPTDTGCHSPCGVIIREVVLGDQSMNESKFVWGSNSYAWLL